MFVFLAHSMRLIDMRSLPKR